MWELAFRVVGGIHLVIAGGNCLLPWIFAYRRRRLAEWDPFLRQIFHAHTIFIILVLTLIGLLCLFYPAELARTPMGRAICAGLALFWALRVFMHFAYFDHAEMNRFWYIAWPFLLVILTFTGLFAVSAAGLVT